MTVKIDPDGNAGFDASRHAHAGQHNHRTNLTSMMNRQQTGIDSSDTSGDAPQRAVVAWRATHHTRKHFPGGILAEQGVGAVNPSAIRRTYGTRPRLIGGTEFKIPRRLAERPPRCPNPTSARRPFPSASRRGACRTIIAIRCRCDSESFVTTITTVANAKIATAPNVILDAGKKLR